MNVDGIVVANHLEIASFLHGFWSSLWVYAKYNTISMLVLANAPVV